MIGYPPLAEKQNPAYEFLLIYFSHTMKKDIHPTYFPEAKIVCACGHVFTMGATKQEMEIEICSYCHPFYTGKEKLVDTAGRIEKYQTRVKKSSAIKAVAPVRRASRARKEQKSAKQILAPSPKLRVSKANKANAK